MRDTPETDATYQFGMGRVSVNFARRLERERDEARELIKILQDEIHDLRKECQHLHRLAYDE